jgi:dsRNA-specific ribonuclease
MTQSLKAMFPKLPSENVEAIRDHLLGDERLNNVARAFGLNSIVRRGDVCGSTERVTTYILSITSLFLSLLVHHLINLLKKK